MVLQQVTCPQCRRSVEAPVTQLFDVGEDPRWRDVLLSGHFNIIQCPHCGYVGQVPLPLVYHDPEHELLLVYIPPELGLSQAEQEQVVGPLLRRVVERLPAERRKGYLLQPQYILSFRTLVERILEAEGIPREELEKHEKRLSLLRRLLNASHEGRRQILQQEAELVDAHLWRLLEYLKQSAEMAQDTVLAQRIQDIQELILEETPLGRELQQAQETWKQIEAFLQQLPARISPQELVDRLLQWPHLSRDHVLLMTIVLPQLLTYEVLLALQQVQEQGSVEARAKAREVHQWLVALMEELEHLHQRRFHETVQLLRTWLTTQDPKAEEELLTQIVRMFQQDPELVQQALVRVGQEWQTRPERRQQWKEKQRRLEERLFTPQERLLQKLLQTEDEAIWRIQLRKHQDLVDEKLLRLITEMLYGEPSEPIKSRLEKLFTLVSREVMRRKLQSGQASSQAQTRVQPQQTSSQSAPAPSTATRPRVLRPGEEAPPDGPNELLRPS